MKKFKIQDVEQMPAEKVIETAQAERGAAISFAPKKDGSFRFCSDYQKLDVVAVRDAYPLPQLYPFLIA